MATYPDAVAEELDRATALAGSILRPRTIYVGGGTPTLLGDGLLALLKYLRARLDLSRLEELSIEARPDFEDPSFVRELAVLGVNRVSMGIQTLDGASLDAVGRDQAASDIPRAFAMLRKGGIRNVGADLIVGLPRARPGQTLRDLHAILPLRPSHVSLYSLMVEPCTPLAARAETGEWTPPSDDDLLDSLDEASRALSAAGFRRYEISNYARRGRECRYNLAVWRGEDYLGLGPSAASRVGFARWTNLPDADAYRTAAENGAPFPRDFETQSPADDAEGRFLFGLRLAEGADPDAFAALHPAATPLLPHWKKALDDAVGQRLVRRLGSRYRLTRRGREVADAVLESLM